MSAHQRSESSRGGPACPSIPGLTGKHGKQRNCRGEPACPPIRWQKSEDSVPELYKDQARRQTDIRLLNGRGGPACPPIPGLTEEHGKQRNCRGGPACPPSYNTLLPVCFSGNIVRVDTWVHPYVLEVGNRKVRYNTYFRRTHGSAPTVHI